MSKKIAAGANAIVLDVKVGLGAFMQSLDEARLLADTMTRIGEMAGRKMKTMLSDMNQPLGYAVGNALEVRESIDVLHGSGPGDFREHCLVTCAHMLLLGNRADSLEAGQKLAERSIQDGTAWEKFRQLVIAQGGNVEVVDKPDQLPQAKYVEAVKSSRRGYLSQIHAQYTVLGDPVNVARRLCDLAGPGEILVAEGLAGRLADRGWLEPAQSVTVRGRTQPVRVFRGGAPRDR